MPYYSLEKRKNYLGDPQSERQKLPPFTPNPSLHDPSLYQPSPALADAVNVALGLGLPLLLTGEPGSGKTELADHLAWFFDLGKPIVFKAQTSSSATDLFYHYDALRHFQYSQNKDNPSLSPQDLESRRFIRYQGLGEAIRNPDELPHRRVVLIDEIDKAPRDLPNDVLDALDKLRFDVPELGKEFKIAPELRPIIILTSNSEKNLPDAFLRRVVYYHIEFPKPEAMLKIVGSKVGGLSEAQIETVTNYFYEHIRQNAQLRMNKYPATAELLQWCGYLRDSGFRMELLDNIASLKDEKAQRNILKSSFSVLAKTREDLEALIKTI